jgi:hypothetical protein
MGWSRIRGRLPAGEANNQAWALYDCSVRFDAKPQHFVTRESIKGRRRSFRRNTPRPRSLTRRLCRALTVSRPERWPHSGRRLPTVASSSHRTLRWRETDSNPRSPAIETMVFARTLRPDSFLRKTHGPSPFRSATEPALSVRRKELTDRYRRKPRSRDKTRSAPRGAVNFSFPDWRDAYIQ